MTLQAAEITGFAVLLLAASVFGYGVLAAARLSRAATLAIRRLRITLGMVALLPVVAWCGNGVLERLSAAWPGESLGAGLIWPAAVGGAILTLLAAGSARELVRSVGISPSDSSTLPDKAPEQLGQKNGDGVGRKTLAATDGGAVTARYARKMENLFNLAMAMGSSLDLDHLLERLLEIVQQAIGYDSASVFVEERSTGRYRALARRGYPDDHPALNIQYDEIAADTLSVMRDTLQPMLISDTRKSPIWKSIEATAYIGSWLGAPLVVRGNVIGTINLNSRRVNHFNESDVQAIASIASQASAAIDNARLFAQVHDQAHHLSQINAHLLALQAASVKMAEAGSVQDVLEIVEGTVQVLLGLDSRISFGLLDSTGTYLRRASDEDRMAVDDLPSAVARALSGRGPTRTRDASAPDSGVATSAGEIMRDHDGQPGAAAHFAMWSRGRPIGIVSVRTRDSEFPPEQIDLLEALSTMAAVAVDNIHLLEDLRTTSSALDDTIASSRDAIITFDVDRIIASWNPAAERIFGMSRQEAIGQTLGQFGISSRFAQNQELFERVMAGQPVEIGEHERVRPDGKSVWLAGVGTPIRNSNGDITGTLVTMRDVTRERLIKRQMAQTEKLSALGQLVAGVAHELNNPLTSVMGFGQLLKSQPLDEQGQRDVERVIEQSKRAARIVKNLLVFARDHEPTWAETDVNAILSAVLDMRSYELTLLDIAVEMDLAAELPVIQADPYQLHQVFVNLVINAEQAMEADGGGRLSVKSMPVDGEMVRVEISDTGPGIAPEHIPRVFDPFFTTKDTGKGTGMGLSICYGIVEEHGGRIWAEHVPSGGACFVVELPMLLPAAVDALPGGAATADGAPDSGSVARTGERVLVVDDEETIVGMVGQVLRAWGYAVDVAASGADAWQLLKENHYGLVLMDLRMPGMSGQTLLSRMQETRPEQVDRIVFMTGDTASAEAARFLAEAERPVLKKPFGLARLREVVQDTMGGNLPPAGRED